MRGIIAGCLLVASACEGPPPPPAPAAAPGAQAQPLFGPVACAACGLPSGPQHGCGKTRWCGACRRDAGAHHACGDTAYCGSCRRETGLSHECAVTRLCLNPSCRSAGRFLESGPNHVCGKSRYCPRCRVDHLIGPDAECRLGSYACPRCEREVLPEHACGRSQFCRGCGLLRATRAPCPPHAPEPRSDCSRCRSPHDCGRSSFCPTCGSERPLVHDHSFGS